MTFTVCDTSVSQHPAWVGGAAGDESGTPPPLHAQLYWCVTETTSAK